MHVILGSTGRVGSAVVAQMLQRGQAIKAVTRNSDKVSELKGKGVAVAIADAKDVASLVDAFKDGHTLFAITPETGHEEDVIKEGRLLLENYRRAVKRSSIQKIVGLSSIGAQHEKGTGNLQISHMLEHTFVDLPARQVFIRPAYYFSNWMLYFSTAKESGILPSFFPANFSISMISPEDVGKFAAEVLLADGKENQIYEIEGPQSYTPADIAAVFSEVLGKAVKVHPIERGQWATTLRQARFSPDATKNFIDMTDAVLDGRATAEGKGTIKIKGTTTFRQYVASILKDEPAILNK